MGCNKTVCMIIFGQVSVCPFLADWYILVRSECVCVCVISWSDQNVCVCVCTCVCACCVCVCMCVCIHACFHVYLSLCHWNTCTICVKEFVRAWSYYRYYCVFFCHTHQFEGDSSGPGTMRESEFVGLLVRITDECSTAMEQMQQSLQQRQTQLFAKELRSRQRENLKKLLTW